MEAHKSKTFGSPGNKVSMTIKQIVHIPENHELKIKIPEHIKANGLVEVVLLVNVEKSHKEKIEKLKKSKTDKLFLEDMQTMVEDFKAVDAEGL